MTASWYEREVNRLRNEIGQIEAHLLDAHRYRDGVLKHLCLRMADRARAAVANSIIEESSERAAPILDEAIENMERHIPFAWVGALIAPALAVLAMGGLA